MIFKQVREIVNGTKTQTRRIMKPGERLVWNDDDNYHHIVLTPGGRVKWRVGQDYAVVPKRGYHGVHYDIETRIIYGHGYEPLGEASKPSGIIVPLRYKILSIHHEPLQDISEKNARAEGLNGFGNARLGYSRLWESINGPCSWDDNPAVWVIKFEVLRPE